MKQAILFIAAILIGLSSKAQITLDNTFSPTGPSSGGAILFSANGEKIMMNDTGINQVKLYNTDYSLWKTINLSNYTGYKFQSALAVSDHLFNSDNLVELVAIYYSSTSTPNYKVEVINESGTVLQSLGSCYYAQVHVIGGNYKLFTYTINAGTPAYSSSSIYSLPGTLPCGECSSLGVERTTGESRESLSGAVPNPNDGDATISYQLPAGVQEGTISLYNTNGQVMKTYKVGNNFQSINIGGAALPAGVYYYNLSGPGITPMGNKMVVIR